ncbi:MAG TPA: PKD domain-containing protein [Planctomycetota bacterium]|nr:PKD domain-containing protein [Planctomycetota bacterium]
MHATRRTVSALFLSLVLIVLAATSAGALTLRSASWQQLRAATSLIISARIVDQQSEENPAAPYGVQTRVQLGGVSVLSGEPNEAVSDILLPGGTLGQQRVSIPGAPKFSVGESVILFLRPLGDAGVNSYTLTGHGMGVLLRSADCTFVRPDVSVEGGVPPAGEAYARFLDRLASVPAVAAGQPSSSSRLWLVPVLFGLSAMLIFWRRRRAAALVLMLLCGTSAVLFVSQPAAAAPKSRGEFVLSEARWDLNRQTPGRVENGKLLWVRGKPSFRLPPDETFDTIRQQFQKWEDIPESSIAFRQDGLTLESGNAIDGRNVISFLPDPPRQAFDNLTLAITFLVSDTRTNLYFDADIVFNDRDFSWSLHDGSESIEGVALHEVGHFIGLDHTTDANTVMFPTAQGLTQLAEGDRQGAAFIYPLPLTPPFAAAIASPTAGQAPLTVSFSAEASYSPAGSTLTYLWDFGDGSTSTEVSPSHTYAAPGVYTAILTVNDPALGQGSTRVIINVTNAAVPISIAKFSLTSALIESTRDSDKLSFAVSGITPSPGDELQMSLGRIRIGRLPLEEGALPDPIPLDSKLSFRGEASTPGKIQVKFDARNQLLNVSLSGADLDRLDPRGLNDTVLAGSGSLPLRIILRKAGGESVLHEGDATFFFTIKTSNTSRGFLEKTLTAKK